jgi:hypothetical protein
VSVNLSRTHATHPVRPRTRNPSLIIELQQRAAAHGSSRPTPFTLPEEEALRASDPSLDSGVLGGEARAYSELPSLRSIL